MACIFVYLTTLIKVSLLILTAAIYAQVLVIDRDACILLESALRHLVREVN